MAGSRMIRSEVDQRTALSPGQGHSFILISGRQGKDERLAWGHRGCMNNKLVFLLWTKVSGQSHLTVDRNSNGDQGAAPTPLQRGSLVLTTAKVSITFLTTPAAHNCCLYSQITSSIHPLRSLPSPSCSGLSRAVCSSAGSSSVRFEASKGLIMSCSRVTWTPWSKINIVHCVRPILERFETW